MEDLIKALTIFSKYTKNSYHNEYPTSCDHDILRVHVSPDFVSEYDKLTLGSLGFFPDFELDCFVSYKYGSC
jgi:hypothetical protein